MEPGTRDPRVLASFVPWCRKRSDVFKRLKHGIDVFNSHWKLTKIILKPLIEEVKSISTKVLEFADSTIKLLQFCILEDRMLDEMLMRQGEIGNR